MAEGGIYDQLGGGFHRYSTERTWTVPHFEKMLYDNAQLVEVYSKMYEIDPQPLYERAVRETLAFIKREMTSADGAFYCLLKVNVPDQLIRGEGAPSVAMVLAERLIREHKVAVIPGPAFGMTEGCYFRVAYGALQKETVAEGIGRLVKGLRAMLG